MNSKMLLVIAALGMGVSAFQPAHASSQTCKDTAIACGALVTGSLLVCAAAASEVGANPIADIACADLAQASRGACLTMPLVCARKTGVTQALRTLSFAGRTSGAVDETRVCPGSHRVTGMSILRENNLIRRVRFTCSNGTIINTGPALGSVVSSSCSLGTLVQGADVILTSGGTHVVGFDMKCDVAVNTTASDYSSALGTLPAGGSKASRLCAEGSYLAGYRAFHDGSSGYLRGIGFLCQALPK